MNPYTIEFLEELYKGFSSSRKKIRKETLKKLKGVIAQEKAKIAVKLVISKDGIRYVTADGKCILEFGPNSREEHCLPGAKKLWKEEYINND